MDYEHMLIEKDDTVATVILNPKKLFIIHARTYREILIRSNLISQSLIKD